MIDNAVSFYKHLREQDVRPSEALEHAVQKYGVPRDTLMERVNGRVANPEETRAALAHAKAVLTGDPHVYGDPDDNVEVIGEALRVLYNAITGEDV